MLGRRSSTRASAAHVVQPPCRGWVRTTPSPYASEGPSRQTRRSVRETFPACDQEVRCQPEWGVCLVMSSRLAATIAVVAGLAGAGVGATGAILVVEQGPAGPQGPSGERGPRGFEGPAADTFDLETSVDDLESRLSDLEDQSGYTDVGSAVDDLVFTTDDLDFRLSQVESDVSDICFELDLFC
jgi:hypothetical protein